MLELSKFVESQKPAENNPALKLFPLFYKLSPEDLKDEKMEDSMEEVVGGS